MVFQTACEAFVGSAVLNARPTKSTWTGSCSLGKRGTRLSRASVVRVGAVRMASQKPETSKESKAKEKGSNMDNDEGQDVGEGPGYWRGEWVCVDCGYIYKPGRKIKFEDLPGSWKCPQCQAPKRRFAKKAGDYIAETAGTSNLPIIIFSVVGLVVTVLFGIWATTQL